MAKKSTKQQYRLRNWTEYNKALVRRGSLTLWVSDEIIAQRHETRRTGKRGAPRTYTDTAILCMATLEEVYGLPLRATEGLLSSVVKLLAVELRVPDYTTLCRRRQALEIELPRQKKKAPLHLVVDSTGVKVYGEGEWKVRQHGNSQQERHARDENVRSIRRHGRAKWKRESHYHRHSLAETTMFRLPLVIG